MVNVKIKKLVNLSAKQTTRISNQMTERLPLSLQVSSELIESFVKIEPVANKLCAQLNFITMTANWYGDEDNILLIDLLLETPEFFSFQKRQHTKELKNLNHFSDDVFSSFDENKNLITCVVAITASEINLLEQQTKILPAYLQKKLEKVLNLIAANFDLPAI